MSLELEMIVYGIEMRIARTSKLITIDEFAEEIGIPVDELKEIENWGDFNA